jgi:hypothetical protein
MFCCLQRREQSFTSQTATVSGGWRRYSLDLNGEFSAFDGHLLAEQAAFALACLKQLRAMYSMTANTSSCAGQAQDHQRLDLSQIPYNMRPQPLSHASSSGDCSGAAAVVPAVVLAGHSMGGVVARAAATAAWEDPELGGSHGMYRETLQH